MSTGAIACPFCGARRPTYDGLTPAAKVALALVVLAIVGTMVSVLRP